MDATEDGGGAGRRGGGGGRRPLRRDRHNVERGADDDDQTPDMEHTAASSSSASRHLHAAKEGSNQGGAVASSVAADDEGDSGKDGGTPPPAAAAYHKELHSLESHPPHHHLQHQQHLQHDESHHLYNPNHNEGHHHHHVQQQQHPHNQLHPHSQPLPQDMPLSLPTGQAAQSVGMHNEHHHVRTSGPHGGSYRKQKHALAAAQPRGADGAPVTAEKPPPPPPQPAHTMPLNSVSGSGPGAPQQARGDYLQRLVRDDAEAAAVAADLDGAPAAAAVRTSVYEQASTAAALGHHGPPPALDARHRSTAGADMVDDGDHPPPPVAAPHPHSHLSAHHQQGGGVGHDGPGDMAQQMHVQQHQHHQQHQQAPPQGGGDGQNPPTHLAHGGPPPQLQPHDGWGGQPGGPPLHQPPYSTAPAASSGNMMPPNSVAAAAAAAASGSGIAGDELHSTNPKRDLELLHTSWDVSRERLKQLREMGVFVRNGRWLDHEVKRLDFNVQRYLRLHNVENVQAVVGRGDRGPRKEFYMAVADGIFRPLFFIYRRVLRQFCDQKKGKRFSYDETMEIIRLHEVHGNNWKEIGRVMGRTAGSVHDHFRHSVKKNTDINPMNLHDETYALAELLRGWEIEPPSDLVGPQNLINWNQVAASIGHVEAPSRLRHKWKNTVCHRMPASFALPMLHIIRDKGYTSFDQIDWHTTAQEVHARQRKLRNLLVSLWTKVPRQGSFQDAVKYLIEKFETSPLDEKDVINEDGGPADPAVLASAGGAHGAHAAAAHANIHGAAAHPPLPPGPMASSAGVPAAASVDSSDTMDQHDSRGPPAAKRTKNA